MKKTRKGLISVEKVRRYFKDAVSFLNIEELGALTKACQCRIEIGYEKKKTKKQKQIKMDLL